MDTPSSLLNLLPDSWTSGWAGNWRAPGIQQLLTLLETYLPPDDIERVREAYEVANEAHRGQKRMTGEPYITHPIAAAGIPGDSTGDRARWVAHAADAAAVKEAPLTPKK